MSRPAYVWHTLKRIQSMRDPDRDEIARTMCGDYKKMSNNPNSRDYRPIPVAAKAKAAAKRKAKTDAYAIVE